MRETHVMSDNVANDNVINDNLINSTEGGQAQPGELFPTGTPESAGVPVVHPSSFPDGTTLAFDRVTYGPDIADESVLRLLGNVEGKRILELGAGSGHSAIAMARQGAHVISVDPSTDRLDRARENCENEEVKVELRLNDLADLAFVRADTIDAVLSIYALSTVDDLDRVFRQVHRVLHTGCPFVISLPHPVWTMVDVDVDVNVDGGTGTKVAKPYFTSARRPSSGTGNSGVFPRTISEIFTSLVRANFRVDTLLEPEPGSGPRSEIWNEIMTKVPATLILRARKEGN